MATVNAIPKPTPATLFKLLVPSLLGILFIVRCLSTARRRSCSTIW